MVLDQLKRKLKQLRQAEIAIRFKNTRNGADPGARLVWHEFFTVKPKPHQNVRYPLDQLLAMEPDQRKRVFADYFCFVYYQYYRENGLAIEDVYNPQLLALLGLPPSATGVDVKRRFRELAKQYHPDAGGDSQQFIELMDVYKGLMDSDNSSIR